MIHDLFSKALLKCLNPWLGLHICLVVSNRFDPRMEWLNGHQLMQTSLFTDCCWIWTSAAKSAAQTSTNQHKGMKMTYLSKSWGYFETPSSWLGLFNLWIHIHPHSPFSLLLTTLVGALIEPKSVWCLADAHFCANEGWCVDLRFFYTWFGWTWRNVISHIFTRKTTAWRFPTI